MARDPVNRGKKEHFEKRLKHNPKKRKKMLESILQGGDEYDVKDMVKNIKRKKLYERRVKSLTEKGW